MDDRKRLVVTAFELASSRYDGSWNRCFDLQADALVREAHIHGGETVLDVATGTGKAAVAAARAVGPNGRVVGIDLSDAMLAQAHAKATGLPIEFKLMDAESLAYDDGIFDVVLCGFGMAFLPDRVRGMREIHRVLRPGGRVAFSWWTREAFEPMDSITMARLESQYGVPKPSAPPEPWMALKEPEHLLTLLEKGGFQSRRVVREDVGYLITAEDWWGLVTGTAWQRHLSRLSPEAIERLRGETLEEIGRVAGDKGVWMDVSAHIGVGRSRRTGGHKMAHTSNRGVRIHYELEGTGQPLVLQHGFTDSLQTWYELGYVDALSHKYQLILVDARGHGASGKPHETSAYGAENHAADIVAVLDDLDIQRAHFFGYSMGGFIGFAMAKHAPNRVSSLIIGGAIGAARRRNGSPFLQALEGGADAIPAIWGVPLPSPLHARLLANDVEALKACVTDRPSFADILPTMVMPCLVFAGEADDVYPAVKSVVAQMPNATFFSLPGLGHSESYLRSDLVLPHVIKFLDKSA